MISGAFAGSHLTVAGMFGCTKATLAKGTAYLGAVGRSPGSWIERHMRRRNIARRNSWLLPRKPHPSLAEKPVCVRCKRRCSWLRSRRTRHRPPCRQPPGGRSYRLPLGRRKRHPGEPPEEPGAGPLDQHPGAGKSRASPQAHRGRPPHHPRHGPPGGEVPATRPGPDQRPEDEESRPR